MIELKGRSISGGIAIGRIHVFTREESTVKRYHIEDTEKEYTRFEQARQIAIDQLDALYNKALKEVGESNAMIFDIHKMMLDDMDYLDSIKNMIETQKINAETAVAQTADNFAEIFSSMEDTYMKERAADVKDISERVISVLSGRDNGAIAGDEPEILFADALAPSETVQMDKSKILAIVTVTGSQSSHSAILARTMNIPSVGGIHGLLDESYDGKTVAVDGYKGIIYIDPDEGTIARLSSEKKKRSEDAELLKTLKGKKSITRDGKEIKLFANIGSLDDLGAVLVNDAQGIGLFRSEFLFLDGDTPPTEEEQFVVYRDVLEKMGGRTVVIRTLDIGADKQAACIPMPQEENPALGVRGVRLCLKYPDIFKTQLRALLRASVFGKLAIMVPMIVSADEIRSVRALLKEAKSELSTDGIPYSDSVELGIMIETPAAAVMSDELAKEADFFSVGSNDLTQYTLAADRQNDELTELCSQNIKAVLRLIKTAADNAHKNGIWIGICGELGADLSLTETFLAMGIDELSVTPSAILPLRKKIIETTVENVKLNI